MRYDSRSDEPLLSEGGNASAWITVVSFHPPFHFSDTRPAHPLPLSCPADSCQDDDPGAENGHLVLLQLPAAQGAGLVGFGSRRSTFATGGHPTTHDRGRARPHGQVFQVGAAVPTGLHEKRGRGVPRGVEGCAGCVCRGVYCARAVRSEDGGKYFI